MKTVLNKNKVDILKQPMFLGEDLGIQRYDIVKYPEFKKSYEDQRGQYWQANEIPIAFDRQQYENLNETEKFIFTNNLMFQTVGDSCLSRTIDHLKSYVTNTELEFAMSWWMTMEQTHSESYTWILQNIVDEPSEFFDKIYENEAVMSRAKQLSDNFDTLVATDNDTPEDAIKQSLFNTVLSLQIAEGVLFYSSFACTFWFGSKGVMKGNSDIIKLINNDENLHVAITQNIMKRWKNDPTEGFQDIMTKNEQKIYDAYKLAVDNEKDWIKYLFSKGTLLGLNVDLLCGYVEWVANTRLRSMGYKQIFDTKKNPLGSWIKEFINSDDVDPAPQEKPITDYEKGKFKNDLDSVDMDFDFS